GPPLHARCVRRGLHCGQPVWPRSDPLGGTRRQGVPYRRSAAPVDRDADGDTAGPPASGRGAGDAAPMLLPVDPVKPGLPHTPDRLEP
ncbi:MAG: hypothetical protein J2P15_13115, partial [Micromonosporaceae bacterium]|nr:hypothetical protein [Micromonosporaceae bacterium]